MKKYLITGGCGFIGQHLAKRLLKTKCIIDLIDLPEKKNLIKSSKTQIKIRYCFSSSRSNI